jgi:hypothetical protein
MARCPTCNASLPRDRLRLGARCPHCHDPLYEPERKFGQPAGDRDGSCPVHPGVVVEGICDRCGNYLCEVCRSHWRGQVVCVACVSRALEQQEAAPEQVRAHHRQAQLGFILGLAAWGVGVGALLLAVLVPADDPDARGLQVLAVLLLVLALPLAGLVALLGLGQAATALRTRGSSMILATLGLLVSGFFLGAILGLFSFVLWQV